MAPGSFAVTRADVDVRVGGHYRIWQSSSGWEVGGFEAELAELIPGQRIVLRWGFAGPERRARRVFDSLLTNASRSSRRTTGLTLVHERLDDRAADMPHVAASVESGWEDCLRKLASVLVSSRPHSPASAQP